VLDLEADADRVYRLLVEAMEAVRQAMVPIRNDLAEAVRAAGLWYHDPTPRPTAARTRTAGLTTPRHRIRMPHLIDRQVGCLKATLFTDLGSSGLLDVGAADPAWPWPGVAGDHVFDVVYVGSELRVAAGFQHCGAEVVVHAAVGQKQHVIGDGAVPAPDESPALQGRQESRPSWPSRPHEHDRATAGRERSTDPERIAAAEFANPQPRRPDINPSVPVRANDRRITPGAQTYEAPLPVSWVVGMGQGPGCGAGQ
jgi:hypothetical protein